MIKLVGATKVKLSSTTKYKNGNTKHTFNYFSSKDKKYFCGEIYEVPVYWGKEAVAVRYSIYIKQKDNIIAFVTGLCSSWEYYFDKFPYDKIRAACYRDRFVFDEFLCLQKFLKKNEFNESVYDKIVKDIFQFGHDNGFCLVSKIFVVPEFRKTDAHDVLFRVLKEKYDGDVIFVISDRPVVVANIENLGGLGKNIKPNRLNSITKYDRKYYSSRVKNEEKIKQFFRKDIIYTYNMPSIYSAYRHKIHVVVSKKLREIINYYKEEV